MPVIGIIFCLTMSLIYDLDRPDSKFCGVIIFINLFLHKLIYSSINIILLDSFGEKLLAMGESCDQRFADLLHGLEHSHLDPRAHSISRLALPLQRLSTPLLAHDRRGGAQRPTSRHQLRLLLLPQLRDHDLVGASDKQLGDLQSPNVVGRHGSFDLRYKYKSR